MEYSEQQSIERLNKQIFDTITQTVPAEEFIAFYKTHNRSQTMERYGIRTSKQLVKILKAFGYDFSVPKGLNKGKPSIRSHESYVEGGRKSAETQRQAWQSKSAEKQAEWAEKQRIAHSTEAFRTKIKQINLDYWANLSEEEKQRINEKKSKSAKSKWLALTEDERQSIMGNRFKNGKCYHAKDSQPDLRFAKILDEFGISYQRELCLDRKKFDFAIEASKTLIEIDPTITHNVMIVPFDTHPPIDKYYHANKTRLAEKYGYRCIHIFDWDDEMKIAKLLIKRETVYARDCEIRELSKKEAKEFLNENHLQGYARDDLRFGLLIEGRLVSLMTFGKPRYNKHYDYELIRYCSVANVIGGAEKLFSHFLKLYPDASVISYCDLSKFSGQVYNKLEFKLLRSPTPSAHWSNYRTNEHFTDNLLRQQGFSRLVHHCDAKDDDLPTDDNEELMVQAGFVKVYDCGQATYVYGLAK